MLHSVPAELEEPPENLRSTIEAQGVSSMAFAPYGFPRFRSAKQLLARLNARVQDYLRRAKRTRRGLKLTSTTKMVIFATFGRQQQPRYLSVRQSFS